MPTFKHPCPYCDKFIDRAVAACPFCGQVDPFAPKRCQNCRKIIEDAAWIVCPGCGQSLLGPAIVNAVPSDSAAAAPSAPAAPTAPAAPSAPAAPMAPAPRPALSVDALAPALASAGPCGGCGAPLPAGARFCTICGTVAG
jgi:RNA polymerase subunit RPABC4/transcription elongation factor Spt4